MKRALLAAVLVVFAAGTAQADDWPGLYQGIGEHDGSFDSLSIIPQEDGTYIVRWTASEVAFCGEERVGAVGFETAQLDGEHLVSVERQYRCEGTDELLSIESQSRMWLENDANLLFLEVPGGIIHLHRMSHN